MLKTGAEDGLSTLLMHFTHEYKRSVTCLRCTTATD